MGKIPEKHDTLPEMLPDSANLIVDGKLYTLSYWRELAEKRDGFKEKEKKQLNNLYQHYKAFYQKRGKERDLHKMEKAKNIAEKIEVELLGSEEDIQ